MTVVVDWSFANDQGDTWAERPNSYEYFSTKSAMGDM